MAHPFYPFVDNEGAQEGRGLSDGTARQRFSASVVNYAARIAVYDDAAAAPRVVVVDPSDVRTYLEEITTQVTQLSHEQGGTIPFMVIREVVENFIHAYFIEPTITILDGGNTIRFSDQGPGIKEKERALEYGTSSATEEMKRYIRGVGSGLPYAQQYMVDKGGSLTIEDNISQGTVVTISTRPAATDNVRPHALPSTGQRETSPQVAPQQQPTYPWPAQPGTWQGWPQQASPQQVPQQPYDPYAQQQPYQPWNVPSTPYQGAPSSWGGYPSQPAHQPPTAQDPGNHDAGQFSWVRLTVRGRAILDYIAHHETVGPTELARAYGESQPTWTRELKTLEEDGILKKDGQKRRLTRMGEAYLESLG